MDGALTFTHMYMYVIHISLNFNILLNCKYPVRMLYTCEVQYYAYCSKGFDCVV